MKHGILLFFSTLYIFFSCFNQCFIVRMHTGTYSVFFMVPWKEESNKKLKSNRILSLGCIWFWTRTLILKTRVWRCSIIEIGSVLWCKIFSTVRHWSVDKMCNGSTTSTYKIFLSSILRLVPWHIPSRQCAW